MRFLRLVQYSFKLAVLKLQKKDDEFAETLIELVKIQGGLYVKFMQILAMQTGLLTENHMANLLSLYDEAGYEPININEVLRKELGPDITKLTLVQPEPFSAGAFAQVYKAKLQNGEDVIIKVKKNNLKFKLFFDFAMMKIFLFIVDTIYNIPLIDPYKIFAEFKKNTYNELDYKKEAGNATYLYQCYAGHTLVKIPKTYSELCTDKIIVQEFIPGLLMTHLIRAKSENPDLYHQYINQYNIKVDTLLKSIAYNVSRQGPAYNKFYGDPHPGNIILTGGNTFALIDFGIVDDLYIDKGNFFNIIKSVVDLSEESDTKDLSKEIIKFGATDLYESLEVIDETSGNDTSLLNSVSSNYSEMISTKVTGFIGIKDAPGGLTEIFYDMVKLGNKFNIKLPEMLLNILRSSAMFSSYANYLLPGRDVMPEVYRQLLYDFRDDLTSNLPDRKKPDMEQAIVYLTEWLTGIAEKDIVLYSKLRKVMEDSTPSFRT